ncbi:MOSC domain-containing protein [Pseudomonas sp. App30]|uniref:MOSC domain-containing protein n=1 Tax=Pseudomonas sp. App30 TaxID=3068990 RepID=UPI003A813108
MRLGQLEALLVGKAVPFARRGTRSAIAKQAVEGALAATALGLAGDEQGDLRIHGGVDKAIHLYPREHYTRWQQLIGEHPLLAAPGAFGENLATVGMTEQTICLGDVIRCGTTLLEVSQTRQPCWKLNDRFGVPDMALRMQGTGMTGWYFRVLEGGQMRAGDRFALEARPHPDWSLARVVAVLYQRTLDRDELLGLAALPLVPSWQRLVQRRVEQAQVEDWSGRLCGPAQMTVEGG